MDLKTIGLACLFATGLLYELSGQTGLKAEYYNGQNFDQLVLTRTDAQINFVWDNVVPVPGIINPQLYSVRWTGQIQAPESGTYMFRAHVDDGIRVLINGQSVINAWGMHDSKKFTGEIYLHAGQQYKLQVDYFNALFEGEIQLFWQLPSETPVFKGLLGYNDHVIDGRFLSQPPQPVVATKPPSNPPAKPATKPVTPRPPKAAVIAKDTLEKYLPKNVLFEKSKAILLVESAPELDRLAGFLLRNPRYKLQVDGHTDRVGNAAKNLALSKERANKVAEYLIQKGIAASRINAEGYGDTRPLVLEAPGVPNEKNRRVEFKVME